MKIKLANGDFITLDEKVYPQKEAKFPIEPEPEDPKTELTASEKLIIGVTIIFAGFYFKKILKNL